MFYFLSFFGVEETYTFSLLTRIPPHILAYNISQATAAFMLDTQCAYWQLAQDICCKLWTNWPGM